METSHPTVRFFIDQPGDWSNPSACIIIRGWGFTHRREALRGIRLLVADRTLHGVTGLPRPDVHAALAEAPGDNTGFEIRGTLPSGQQNLSVEAQLPDGTWTPILVQPVRVQRQLVPFWLGGGGWEELMFFQMPAHAAHAPRPLRLESFPRRTNAAPRPRLTIVTPSYQQSAFLGETIRSVLDQPDVACDYVIQDGGSSDGSVEIIERFARDYRGSAALRTVAWVSAPDGGQADAIARGFAKTSGKPDEIMAWINSDDFYLPGTLGFVAEYFAQHPEVDVIYGHRIVVNEHSQEIARWFLPQHEPAVLRLNDFVPQETLFWRRGIWDKVGGIDPSFKFAMDWDLLLRFQAAGANIVRVPYFLACFRVHAAQKTSAQMQSVGQAEITRLREQTAGRVFPARELETNPTLLRYLRRSSWIEFLWRLGVRAP